MTKTWIYKTAKGKEVMTFFQWVNETGTEADLAVHDGGPSDELTALLNKYFIELNVATVTVYEGKTLIDGPNPITTF